MFVTLQLVAMHTEVRRRRIATLERRIARGDAR
jgi:heme exporter protein C